VEELKAALRELARREPEFLIGLIADAASSRRDLALKLASVVAGVVAVPLDVATKQDIRSWRGGRPGWRERYRRSRTPWPPRRT
jgi:hypothetical protein